MTRGLRIAALEPYAALSHRLFLEGLARHSSHRIEVFSLPARFWKWRMRTAAPHFARLVSERGPWDAFLASDYLDLATFRALLPRALRDTPAWVYFHENQLTYPLQANEPRDLHFGWTHLTSLAAANGALFNSAYHRRSLLDALPELVAGIPDVELTWAVEAARERSGVLPLGTDLPRGEPRRPGPEPPVVLWNHRWEYDKDPDALVEAVVGLARRGADFRLRLLGERFRRLPPAHARLREELGERIVEDGFLPDRDAYARALAESHVVVSTARHEFFGLGSLEALRTGLLPVLPDDLSYPELVPAPHRTRFLYRREEGVQEALGRALETVRTDADLGPRGELVRWTDRFDWEQLAPRYDAWLAGEDGFAGVPSTA